MAVGSVPAWLGWLQWTSPLLLLPLAGLCEAAIMYEAAPHAKVGGFKISSSQPRTQVYQLESFIYYVYFPLFLPCYYMLGIDALQNAKSWGCPPREADKKVEGKKD